MRSVAVGGIVLSKLVFLPSSVLAQAPYPGDATYAPTPAPPPERPPLEAGGLRPPGELQEEAAAPSEVEQDLERADERDSGRGLQVAWLNAEVGYQYVDLTALSDNGLLPGLDARQSGLMLGGAAGVRVLYFTFGARFRYGTFQHYNLWSLLGEAGFRVPIGSFEPYANVGAGYAALASFDGARVEPLLGTDSLAVRGVDVRLAGGFDYHLSDTFSVGPQIAADLLILSRPGVDTEAGVMSGYGQRGSGLGLSVQGTLVLGLHF